MSGYESSGIKGLLSELQRSRRAKFSYVNPEKEGEFKRAAIPEFILNSLAGCLSIPVLFYVSFHAFRLYSTYGVNIENLLSVLFFGAGLSIFFDIFIGYLYDRLVKQSLNGVKIAFTVIGTVGVILSTGFLFRHDTRPDDVLKQFRWTILGLTLSYTLANTVTFKNTANFTPSQTSRSKLIYADYLIKGFFIFAYVCFPYWIAFWTQNCSCGSTCSDDPEGIACSTCLNTCDTFASSKVFRDVSLAFTSFFGLMNILAQFLVTPRIDEDHEEIETTFNRRISEISRNGLIIRTFFIALLQYIVLFGLAFWFNQYMDSRTSVNISCTNFWGSSTYFCTKSWMKQFTMILALLAVVVVYIISLKWRIIKAVATYFPFVLIPAGILLIVIDFNDSLIYFFVALLAAVFFPTLAVNKLYFTDGIFYDEYLSGSSQAHLPSAIYHMAAKFGFFLSLAFHISLLKIVPSYDQITNTNSEAFGGILILFAFVLFILNYSLNKYNINAFDKVQVAIERNVTHIVQTLTFYDPIERGTINRPISSSNLRDNQLISLFYNLDPRDDLKLAVNGQNQELKSAAIRRLTIFLALLIIFTIIVIIFGSYLNSSWGWFVFIGVLIIPISIYGALYNYNVFVTASILESRKYEENETSIIAKFEPLVKEDIHTS